MSATTLVSCSNPSRCGTSSHIAGSQAHIMCKRQSNTSSKLRDSIQQATLGNVVSSVTNQGFQKSIDAHMDNGGKVEEDYYPNGKRAQRIWTNKDNALHRADGPAVEQWYSNGKPKKKQWFRDGQLFREGSPNNDNTHIPVMEEWDEDGNRTYQGSAPVDTPVDPDSPDIIHEHTKRTKNDKKGQSPKKKKSGMYRAKRTYRMMKRSFRWMRRRFLP